LWEIDESLVLKPVYRAFASYNKPVSAMAFSADSKRIAGDIYFWKIHQSFTDLEQAFKSIQNPDMATKEKPEKGTTIEITSDQD
jgi:hypothetical protein